MFGDCKGWSLQRLGLDWVHGTSERKEGIFPGFQDSWVDNGVAIETEKGGERAWESNSGCIQYGKPERYPCGKVHWAFGYAD